MRAMEFLVKGFCCMDGDHFRRNHILYGVNFGIILQFPIFNIKPALSVLDAGKRICYTYSVKSISPG